MAAGNWYIVVLPCFSWSWKCRCRHEFLKKKKKKCRCRRCFKNATCQMGGTSHTQPTSITLTRHGNADSSIHAPTQVAYAHTSSYRVKQVSCSQTASSRLILGSASLARSAPRSIPRTAREQGYIKTWLALGSWISIFCERRRR